MSGGLMSCGLKSGGLMSGGIKSYDRFPDIWYHIMCGTRNHRK